ncbi:hypothetical protein O9G_001417 [Rozella allomycis CSF55]|uniref:Pre-rRNA-processing protein RIX1 n=1 Tax=Rozella allomycis (strain CSF55) TaxID=988480 RepID=A0A075B3K0_ROZAC|nr:hypothetical protein O9G_001417 [Rozella allomycis CSF55]|eukprot:EPZ36972.1 hypothetical protein O9G_001417 [Rozella allomycis CSF55]
MNLCVKESGNHDIVLESLKLIISILTFFNESNPEVIRDLHQEKIPKLIGIVVNLCSTNDKFFEIASELCHLFPGAMKSQNEKILTMIFKKVDDPFLNSEMAAKCLASLTLAVNKKNLSSNFENCLSKIISTINNCLNDLFTSVEEDSSMKNEEDGYSCAPLPLDGYLRLPILFHRLRNILNFLNQLLIIDRVYLANVPVEQIINLAKRLFRVHPGSKIRPGVEQQEFQLFMACVSSLQSFAFPVISSLSQFILSILEEIVIFSDKRLASVLVTSILSTLDNVKIGQNDKSSLSLQRNLLSILSSLISKSFHVIEPQNRFSLEKYVLGILLNSLTPCFGQTKCVKIHRSIRYQLFKILSGLIFNSKCISPLIPFATRIFGIGLTDQHPKIRQLCSESLNFVDALVRPKVLKSNFISIADSYFDFVSLKCQEKAKMNEETPMINDEKEMLENKLVKGEPSNLKDEKNIDVPIVQIKESKKKIIEKTQPAINKSQIKETISKLSNKRPLDVDCNKELKNIKLELESDSDGPLELNIIDEEPDED